MSVLLILVAVIFALSGGPLFVAIALGTLGAYLGVEPLGIDGANIFVSMGALLDKPHLLPIVLFIFTGYMLAHSGTPKRAVRLAEAFVGWVPGGLAIVGLRRRDRQRFGNDRGCRVPWHRLPVEDGGQPFRMTDVGMKGAVETCRRL